MSTDGEVVMIPRAKIRAGIRLRQSLDLTHAFRLQEVFDLLPPILVRSAGENFDLLDGAHRREAARQLGRDVMAAVVVECSEIEAFTIALKANTTHGLPLSTNDRRKAAAYLIGATDWSDRRIAEAVGVSHMTVNRQRPKVVRQPDAPTPPSPTVTDVTVERREGKDGKRRKPPAPRPPTPDAPTPTKPLLASVPDRTEETSVADLLIVLPDRFAATPECARSNEAREFGNFMDRRAVRRDEWDQHADACPAELVDAAVSVALATADGWRKFAAALRQRPSIKETG